MTAYRTKLVLANAINMIVETNQIIIENLRKNTPAEIVVPRLVDRAFMLVHETGVMPVLDYTAQE